MRPTDVITRPAGIGDTSEIARLAVALGYPFTCCEMKKRLAALLSDTRHRVVVVEDGRERLLGWVHVEHRVSLQGGNRAEIMGLIVEEVARQLGVGAALLGAAEEWAATRSVPTVVVRSNTLRDESHAFYEAQGYARIKNQYVCEKPLLQEGIT